MELVKFNAARNAIAEARSIDEVKDIRDKMQALLLYAKQVGEGLKMQNDVAEIKIRAERRMGEMLDKDLAGKGRPQKMSHDGTFNLSDVGITRNQSSRLQTIARMPEDDFEDHIAKTKSNGKELTTAEIIKKTKRKEANEQKAEIAASFNNLPAEDKIYNVIYADPPWQYDNAIQSWGPARLHYSDLSLSDIQNFPKSINLKIAKNAVLFMWVTNPFLQDAFSVAEEWGFTYKTNIVWVKKNLTKPGSGFYVRGRHELLFICTRGSFTPIDNNQSPPIGSVITSDIGEHSEKPQEAYEIIESLYPNCSYIELFARDGRSGWDSHGYEVGNSEAA